MRFFLALVSACITTSAGAVDNSVREKVVDWQKAALLDIDAVHDILKNDHPGGADPRNPGFLKWLERGRVLARERAARIGGHVGYIRALQYYANGFRDGHIAFSASQRPSRVWPGFYTRLENNGQTVVGASDESGRVSAGSILLSCDGNSPNILYQKRVSPYFVNGDIPHDKVSRSWPLFDAFVDEKNLPKTCIFKQGNRAYKSAVTWQPIEANRRLDLLDAASGLITVSTGMRTVDGVTFITASTFNVFDKEADPIRNLIAKLRAERSAILSVPVIVIDVRGNGGGNSSWGDQIVKALWGDENYRHVSGSFDQAVEWRVSLRNINSTRIMAKRSRDAGLIEDADYRDMMIMKMEAALIAGQSYVAETTPAPVRIAEGALSKQFAGKVFFLTDDNCASACLDFADLVVRMLGVVHIGLPTSADAVYIDNVSAALPSGVGDLSYSIKVYRNRIRANNQWYTPRFLWSGGPMTDANVAAWVKSLPTD